MAQHHLINSFYSRKQKALRFEADVFECEVEGAVPEDLHGALFRVGPDTAFPTLEEDVIINGDGVVSAFYFDNGHVDFRSRYIRTERFLRERAARRRLYGKYRNPFTDDPSTQGTDRDNTANTYGFFHHGRLFALREDSLPTELDPETLATKGTCDFDGELQALAMTAHPKIDPITGEWWGFALFGHKRFEGEMSLQVVDRDGRLVRQEDFVAPYPGISHDFAVTREHIVFPVMPLTVDMERVKAGGDFYAYDAQKNPVYGIMPRDGTVADLRWYEVPQAFMGHVMNAWSEGDVVHFDAAISPGNPFSFFKDKQGLVTEPGLGVGQMTRLSFHLAEQNDRVEITPVPGAVGEMPRCDERYQMARYRYGFGKSRAGLLMVDWETRSCIEHVTPGGASQEPVFVPRHENAPEGDGWVMCVVNRPDENRADLIIVDTARFDREPVATIKLPFNLPMAFHGMFQPGVSSGMI